MQSPLPEPARDGGWEKHGIVSHALEAEEFAKTRANLVRRLEAMIGTGETAAAA